MSWDKGRCSIHTFFPAYVGSGMYLLGTEGVEPEAMVQI